MEKVISKLRETIDDLLADFNGRAEEVKENFSSFKEVFGKEFDLQKENLKEYREKLETEGKKMFNPEEVASNVREELEDAVKNLRTAVDRFLDNAKDRVQKAR